MTVSTVATVHCISIWCENFVEILFDRNLIWWYNKVGEFFIVQNVNSKFCKIVHNSQTKT